MKTIATQHSTAQHSTAQHKLNKFLLAALALPAMLIGGCAHYEPAVTMGGVPSIVADPIKIQAVGYGSPGNFNSLYTAAQAKLMAMRAAKIDAYRSLAEQVYGYRVTANTSVSAFATQNDNVRTYVDAFIRGTRVVSINAIADGSFEATVELELPINFFDCLSRRMAYAGCQGPASSTGYGHDYYPGYRGYRTSYPNYYPGF